MLRAARPLTALVLHRAALRHFCSTPLVAVVARLWSTGSNDFHLSRVADSAAPTLVKDGHERLILKIPHRPSIVVLAADKRSAARVRRSNEMFDITELLDDATAHTAMAGAHSSAATSLAATSAAYTARSTLYADRAAAEGAAAASAHYEGDKRSAAGRSYATAADEYKSAADDYAGESSARRASALEAAMKAQEVQRSARARQGRLESDFPAEC